MSSREQVLCGIHVEESLPITVSWRRNDIIAIKWIANDNNTIKVIAKMADSDSDSEYDSDYKKETSPLYYHIGGEAKKKFSLKRSLPVFKKDFSSFQLSL